MHPTSDQKACPRRLELDGGEILDLNETLTGNGWVQLRMPAMRALDLAEVLTAYDRMVSLVLAAAEVSTTEESLPGHCATSAVSSAGTPLRSRRPSGR